MVCRKFCRQRAWMMDVGRAAFLLNISFIKLISDNMAPKTLSATGKQKEEETIIIRKFALTDAVWGQIDTQTKKLQKQDYFVLPSKLFMTDKGPVLVLIAIKKENTLSGEELETRIRNELQKNSIPLPSTIHYAPARKEAPRVTEQKPEKQPAIPSTIAVSEKTKPAAPGLAPSGPIELPSAVSDKEFLSLATPKKTEKPPEQPSLERETAGQTSSSFEVIRGRGWLAFKGTITKRDGSGVETKQSDSSFSENNTDYVRIPVGKNIYTLYLGKKFLGGNKQQTKEEKTFVLSDSAKQTILREVKKHINDKKRNEQKQILGVIKETLNKLKIIRGEKGWKITTE